MAEQVWLAYFADRTEGWGQVQGIFTTEALARRCCETQVEAHAVQAEEEAAADETLPDYFNATAELRKNAERYRAASWQINDCTKNWELAPDVFSFELWYVTAMDVQDSIDG